MLLQEYFADQLTQLQTFLTDDESGARVLAVDQSLIPVVEKTLIKIDSMDENPHVLMPTTIAFNDPTSYAQEVLSDFESENEAFRDTLRDVGVVLPRPGTGEPVSRLALYVQEVSDSWPPSEGNYILLLYPASVADADSFLQLFRSLAEQTTPPIVKWLALLDLAQLPEDFPDDDPVLALQKWEADSDDVQDDVARQLEHEELPPGERLKLTTLAAGFAAGEGDMESSLLLHEQTIELAREQKDVPSEATAHYHMGNSLLAQEQFELAEGHLSESAVLAVDCDMHHLVGMAMTHLGVCLGKMDRDGEAVEAFDAAAKTFDAVGDVPAHARVYDVRAISALEKEEKQEACEHWRTALALFESIQPGPLDPVRENGIEEISAKLEKHCGGGAS
ncbi:MAG: tetratricopeptide repeat protein [Planctomycetota bacterium]